MAELKSRHFVHVLALEVDSAWRRLPDAERRADAEALLAAAEATGGRVTTYTYSMIGTRADASFLFWRLGSSLEDLESTAALLLRSGLGRWCRIGHWEWRSSRACTTWRGWRFRTRTA